MLSINERKKWKDPESFSSEDDPELLEQDDTIFSLARKINCGVFRNVVIEDFLKGLFGLPNVGGSAGLDLFQVILFSYSRVKYLMHA